MTGKPATPNRPTNISPGQPGRHLQMGAHDPRAGTLSPRPSTYSPRPSLYNWCLTQGSGPWIPGQTGVQTRLKYLTLTSIDC